MSLKGEASTLGYVKSAKFVTHSYTIMPTITFDGQLLSPMLLCLQEASGSFGPRVIEEIKELEAIHRNVHITCSKSGKMDKQLMRNWVENCLAPHVEEKCLLLLDSWDGQKDPSIFESVNENCDRALIPPNTTSLLQPLDRYFFRQYKILRRIQLDDLHIDLHSRKNIVKLHSLIHNQLCSSKFTGMIRFAWINCGYESQANYQFANVLDINFLNVGLDCEVMNCGESSFIRCSHCDVVCCVNHFFVEFHAHF